MPCKISLLDEERKVIPIRMMEPKIKVLRLAKFT